ncbi:hypothetical protein [Halopelagius fulvigenes]|uniref:DUF8113 domain-containing protein n=1 Tax=Halopelagius fulvigenes TaxID=1198324 RepID=A0ABD5TZL4_9EURY
MADEADADGSDGNDEFERVRERAVAALEEGEPISIYLGLVHENGANEYYFGNDVDERELREAATEQLGMLTRVLADQSAASVEEIAELAVERAEAMNLQP